MAAPSVDHRCPKEGTSQSVRTMCINGVLTKNTVPPRYAVCYCECHGDDHGEPGPLYAEPPKWAEYYS